MIGFFIIFMIMIIIIIIIIIIISAVSAVLNAWLSSLLDLSCLLRAHCCQRSSVPWLLGC